MKLFAAARQAAATQASQMVAASTEAARVDRLTREQIDKYPDYCKRSPDPLLPSLS